MKNSRRVVLHVLHEFGVCTHIPMFPSFRVELPRCWMDRGRDPSIDIIVAVRDDVHASTLHAYTPLLSTTMSATNTTPPPPTIVTTEPTGECKITSCFAETEGSEKKIRALLYSKVAESAPPPPPPKDEQTPGSTGSGDSKNKTGI